MLFVAYYRTVLDFVFTLLMWCSEMKEGQQHLDHSKPSSLIYYLPFLCLVLTNNSIPYILYVTGSYEQTKTALHWVVRLLGNLECL